MLKIDEKTALLDEEYKLLRAEILQYIQNYGGGSEELLND